MAVKIGIPVSLTGQFRLQGAQTLAGLQAWADDVNRAGGLPIGRQALPVQIQWRDDASLAANAGKIAAQLLDDDAVDVLIGPYSAPLTRAAAAAAQSRRRLLWNQGGASPAVYRRGNPHIVGILTPADEYLAGLPPAVREACPDASRIAIVRAATGDFPRDVTAGAERAAAAMGFRVTRIWQFNPEPPETAALPATLIAEFAALIGEIRQSPPDILIIAGRFQHDLQLAEMLAQAAPPISAVAVVAAGVDAFRQRLGDLAENFLGPSQWEPDAAPHAIDHGPSTTEVMASLHRAEHAAIDYPMAQAYAAGLVVQRCIQECGSLDDAALRQAAASLDFTTFYGRFRIDAAGRPTGKPALLTQWRHGRKTTVWPPPHRRHPLAHPWR